MNYQTRKPYAETKPAALLQDEAKPEPIPLTEAQIERAARIKSALNRTARERRMASHR